MADYLPKAEQLDTMNQRLAELNEHLQKREDFTAAMAKLDSATKKAESLKDGFSPTATVTQTSTGADVSITDKNGTTNAHIENGSDANVTAENIKSALGYTPLESAPVTSVNGKVGAVEIAASDVGAISSADGSVSNAHLADSAVTTEKLAEAERMTSANIVGALGNYELIEEITLEEVTSSIVRTQEPDGTAYKFRALIIYVRGKTENNNVFGYWYGNNSILIALGRFSNTTAYTTILRGFMMGGLIFAIGADEAGQVVRVSQCNSATVQFSAYPKGYIDYVKFSAANMQVGTIIRFYGIRA